MSAHARVAGRVLGRAFTTDPVFGWLLAGRSDRERRLSTVFTAFAGAAVRHPEGQVLVDSGERVAAVWRPPGAWKAPASDVLRNAPGLLSAFGPGVVRALRLLARVEKHHPPGQHWYLEAIGTVPEARGQGLGPSVLTPVLEQCDAQGLPAYLESSNPRNISFYERHGFRTMPQFPLPAGCPVITPMWRDPH